MIDKKEADKRIYAIEALELELLGRQKSIYNRKANLLQTYYGFEMHSFGLDCRFKTYTDHTFTIDGNVFCDIDDAMEFALTNHSTGVEG